MKFKLAFRYAVGFKPYRMIKTRTAYFPSQGEIEVPEIDRSAVKTVFRVGTLAAGRQGIAKWEFEDAFCAKPDGSKREIVALNDELYVEGVPVEDAVASLATNCIDHPLFDGLWLPKPRDSEPAGKGSTREQLERTHPTPFREYSDDGGAQVRQRLEQRARAFVVLDGKIYVRCHEPILYIDRRYGEAAFKFGKNGPSSGNSDLAGFQGYQWDEAVGHYYNLNEADIGLAELRRRHPDAEIKQIADVEVLDPSMVRATPHAKAVVSHAHAALKQLWQQPLSMLPDAIDRAVELRDALTTAGDQITPRLLKAIESVAMLPEPPAQQLERWTNLAEARPRRPTWSGDHENERETPSRAAEIIQHQNLRKQATAHANDAVMRYSLRPAGMSWEDRAFEINSFSDPKNNLTSVEILSLSKLDEVAHALQADPEPLRYELEAGSRVFLVMAREAYASSPRGLVAACPADGGFRVVFGDLEYRTIVECHLAAALGAEPHLAPEEAQPLEMTP